MPSKALKVDDKKWRALLAMTKKLGAAHVRVGVLASKGGTEMVPGADFNLIALAATHEFGSPAANIPERSFIRRTFEMKRDQLGRVCGALAKAIVVRGLDHLEALAMLGSWGATEVKKTITVGPGVPPPLAQSTIDAKGSDRPLVDTGRLVGAISYEVVPGAPGGGAAEPEGADRGVNYGQG